MRSRLCPFITEVRIESEYLRPHLVRKQSVSVCLQITVTRNADEFVASRRFRSIFESLFCASAETEFPVGPYANKCKVVELKGAWTARAILSVLQILEHPIELLFLSGVYALTANEWRMLAEHEVFRRVCGQVKLVTLNLCGTSGDSLASFFSHGGPWANLEDIMLYECSAIAYEQIVAWENVVNVLPKVERLWLFGTCRALNVDDFRLLDVQSVASPTTFAGERWISSRKGSFDNCVSIVKKEQKSTMQASESGDSSSAPMSEPLALHPNASATDDFKTSATTRVRGLPRMEKRKNRDTILQAQLEFAEDEDVRIHKFIELQNEIERAEIENAYAQLNNMLNNQRQNTPKKQ